MEPTIDAAIRQVLASETRAIPLSWKLFSPEGLFAQLGPTEQDRRAVAETPLFREALRRLTELQRAEAEAFAQLAGQARGPGDKSVVLKLESADT